jgi:tetratricopeptide (TPR) repeat protein
VPDVEAPELELDEDAPAFRRRLAFIVVLITLFGSVIAYLHEQNSNFEDNAARDAQIESIKGFGQQVDASTSFRFDYRVFVQRQLLDRRHVVAAARQRTTAAPDQAQLYGSDSERWTQLRDAIGKDTQVQSSDDANKIDSQLQIDPDEARLRQVVFSNKANDYGNKADAYVALLTVLAVALFLLGLSLTVSGRGRYFLALPGVGIAIICLVWSVLITTGSITKISDNAIELTAQGRALQASGDAKGAIDKYRGAIADSPNLAAAWARLADAEFQAGGTALAGNQFQSISDPEATRRAIDAGEQAISLGESNPSTLSSIGFYHFILKEYGRAADLSQQALDGNDQFPPLVFNLGVVQVAQGDADGARSTYERGIELLKNEQDNGLRAEIIAAARTDLEIAVTNEPDRKELAQEMNGLLSVAEAPILDSRDPAPDEAPHGSSVSDVTVGTDRFRLFASYTADGFDTDTALVNVWYFRPLDRNGEGPFEQVFPMDQVTLTGGDQVSTIPVENGDCLPGGDYRVDVYAGRDLVGSAEQHLEDSPLGTLIVAGGDDVGFTVCHPDNWTPQDTSETPASLAFGNPDDPNQFVAVFSFPIGANAGGDATSRLNATIQAAVAAQGIQLTEAPASGEELLGRTVDGLDVLLPTTTVTGATPLGNVIRITGSAGSDNVVRLVMISAANADDLDLVRSELVNSVRFLRVPDTNAATGG